ncbi:hypothetical protein FPHYL_2930, partial [Fusarium phyllophilum]
MTRLSNVLVLLSVVGSFVAAQFDQEKQNKDAACNNNCFFKYFTNKCNADNPACVCTLKDMREKFLCCIADNCAENVLPEQIERSSNDCDAHGIPFTFDAEAAVTAAEEGTTTATTTATGTESSARSQITSAAAATVTDNSAAKAKVILVFLSLQPIPRASKRSPGPNIKMDEEEEHYDFMYQGWVAHMGEMLHRDMSHVIAEMRANGGIFPATELSPRRPSYPYDYDLFLSLDILPQVDAEEVAVRSLEDEENSVVKAEPGSPDTLAAPESPRSPNLYDIQPFRRSQTPSPVNLVEADVDSPENEATVTVKAEPSPETDDDVVEVPRSPGSPSLYDIPRFYVAPDLSPPPIPSRAPSPRTSPQRNTLG